MARAVLFDLDGTLWDSAGDLTGALNDALAQLGFAAIDERTARGYIGGGVGRFVRRGLAARIGSEPDPQLVARAREMVDCSYRRRFMEANRLYPGAGRLLAALAAADFRLGLVTNKPGRYTGPLVDGFMPETFAAVVAGDTCAAAKPSPEPVHWAARLLAADPDECVFVGDTVVDARTARAAGCAGFVFVEHGYGDLQSLADEDIAADRVAADLDAVAAAVQEIFADEVQVQ